MLSNTTFIIPARIDHPDRMANARIVLNYLLKFTDAKIILIENGPKRHLHYPVEYEFQPNDAPLFHRTKILNDALDKVTTPVVVNYDLDVLLPLLSMHEAEQRILNNQADCVHPWTEPPGCYYVNDKPPVGEDADAYLQSLQASASGFHTSGTGLAVFFRTADYIRMGGENEAFRAYAPEDFERMFRVLRFGLRYQRVPGPVYHLNHFRSPNSNRDNPHMQANEQLYEQLTMHLTKAEYQQYYMDRNLVTIQIGGGLGNRLFMAAFAMGYAAKHGKTFRLHKKHYERQNVHGPQDYLQTIFRNISQLSTVHIDTTVKEPEGHYAIYKEQPALTRNVCFYGYYQDERYFKHIEQQVRDCFRCPPDVEQELRAQYPDLDNAFFLHNRIQRPGVDGVELHGVPLDRYYLNAVLAGMTRKEQHEPGTVCYLFSNMPERNAELIQRLITMFGEHRLLFKEVHEPDEVRALWLMSLCRLGGVCANSSFSWWGSWLNDNPNKIVTMPARWLNNEWPNAGLFYPGVKIINND